MTTLCITTRPENIEDMFKSVNYSEIEDNLDACPNENICQIKESFLETSKDELKYLESFNNGEFIYNIFFKEHNQDLAIELFESIDKMDRNEALKLLDVYKGATKEEIKEVINSLIDL